MQPPGRLPYSTLALTWFGPEELDGRLHLRAQEPIVRPALGDVALRSAELRDRAVPPGGSRSRTPDPSQPDDLRILLRSRTPGVTAYWEGFMVPPSQEGSYVYPTHRGP